MARKKIVAGNWKMNMTPSQAVKWYKCCCWSREYVLRGEGCLHRRNLSRDAS